MKIDVSSIEGYAEMTAEQKLAALEAYEVPEVKPTENPDVTKLKQALNKASSEAAAYKNQLREKQTEAERLEAERAEQEAAIKAELETFRTNSRIADYRAKLMDCGYDSETAMSMASNLPAGINDDFFSAHKSFIDSQKKNIESQLLNKQPSLSVGNPPSQADIDKADMDKLRGYFGLK